MMLKIGRKMRDIQASHTLPKMPHGHKCRRNHGHTYRVHVEVEGEEGDDGIIIDTGELDKVFQYIFDTLDHRYLNDIPGLENPTTENLCKWIWDRVFKVIGDHPQIHKVGIFVWESNDSYGFYDGP